MPTWKDFLISRLGSYSDNRPRGRNEGRVIMYADVMTDSMKEALARPKEGETHQIDI
jgi:excinuclease UvrABC helicase subunit UvrB